MAEPQTGPFFLPLSQWGDRTGEIGNKRAVDQVLKEGEWRLCERYGWPDNRSYLHLVAWGWRLGEERRLIIVNLSEYRSQALVPLPWEDLAGRTWRLTDAFYGEIYARDGLELRQPGLFVDLEGWGFHFFQIA